jgi:hypothetical protein
MKLPTTRLFVIPIPQKDIIELNKGKEISKSVIDRLLEYYLVIRLDAVTNNNCNDYVGEYIPQVCLNGWHITPDMASKMISELVFYHAKQEIHPDCFNAFNDIFRAFESYIQLCFKEAKTQRKDMMIKYIIARDLMLLTVELE